MRKMAAICLAFSALQACQSTSEVAQATRSQWIGKHADEFFRQHGAPVSEFPTADGGKLYRWTGGHGQTYLPSSASGNVSGSGQVSLTVDSPATINYQCALQIDAGPDRTIRNMQIMGDTIGRWRLSRCSEVFQP